MLLNRTLQIGWDALWHVERAGSCDRAEVLPGGDDIW